jgi:hypothetical protein
MTYGHKVSQNIANEIANKIWANPRNIRDCVRVGRMARSVDDIQFLTGNFLNH